MDKVPIPPFASKRTRLVYFQVQKYHKSRYQAIIVSFMPLAPAYLSIKMLTF
jgi:hypothetical protein